MFVNCYNSIVIIDFECFSDVTWEGLVTVGPLSKDDAPFDYTSFIPER